jgi:RNA polymerase sigma factor (sigma-70 family)
LSFSLKDLTHAEPLDVIIDQQTLQRLSQLLGLLETDERELIRLRYSAGLSFVEMAVLLGRKEDAVRKALKRLLERLYNEMEVENA